MALLIVLPPEYIRQTTTSLANLQMLSFSFEPIYSQCKNDTPYRIGPVFGTGRATAYMNHIFFIKAGKQKFYNLL